MPPKHKEEESEHEQSVSDLSEEDACLSSEQNSTKENSDLDSGDDSEYKQENGENWLDPHIEKNFSLLRPRFDAGTSWNTFPLNDENNKRISKLSGLSEEQADCIKNYMPNFKPKLLEAWKKSVEAETDDLDDLYLPFQQEILGPLSQYQDISIMDVDAKNEDEYRRLILLHAMNHVMKVRDRIMHHNQISAVAAANGKPLEDDDVMRDQGFARPRILILCPMRNAAYDLVQMIMELWILTGGTVDGKKRFEDEFGEPKDEDGDEIEGSGPDPSKSDDFNRTFRGNIDDCFRVGIKFTRKSVKLFSDFYSSDIIIASPLGLRLVIDGQREKVPKGARNAKAKRAREADADFLSSINICMIDGADTLHMQNWDHLEYVLEHVNAMPVDSHGCDFSRVQTAYLDGLSRKIRQTISLSKFAFPELNAMLSKPELIDNCLGRWRFESNYTSSIAKKAKPFIDAKYHYFASKTLEAQSEERLAFFTKEVLPKYAKLDQICIFVSSYFDYCQLKQWFTTSATYSFACLSEYEEGGAITGARAKFFNGHAKILLITERFHFYRRIHIRGVKHLIWYSLPDHAGFFAECAQWVGDIYKRPKEEGEEVKKRAPKTESPVLYSQFDVLKLERIVGTNMLEKLF